MVGTNSFTMYTKVKDNKGSESLNVQTRPQDVESYEEQRDKSSQGKLLVQRRRKLPFPTFGVFYFITGFILFLLTSLVVTCTLRKVMSFNYLSFASPPVGVTVMVYDGQKDSVSWPDPPPYQDLPAVARYVLHISEWGSLATNSTHKGIEGYPFVNVFSVSDGPYENSTGVPYFYLTPLELSVKDMEVNNNVSFTVSEAQSDYCSKKKYDPEDPRCAHIIFSGSILKVEKNSDEEQFAKNALFSRHEEMKDWPAEHRWFFAKMEIVNIYVLDYFGGVGVVSVKDYFATNPFK